MVTRGFIFARGGSKGVPLKNLRVINGKTLLHRAIESAMSSGCLDSLTVSTDNNQIASHARNLGVDVLIRPDNLCLDNSPEWLSWQHAIINKPCDVFMSIPTTCPLRQPQDIRQCLDGLLATDNNIIHHDACVTVTLTDASYTTLKIDNTRHLKPWLSNAIRRQEAPECLKAVGVCYAAYPEYILRADNLWAGCVNGVIIPQERSLDIDTEWDLHIAELVLSNSEGNQGTPT